MHWINWAIVALYLMVVVGGPGYFLGPVLGAAVGVVMPEWLRDVPKLADWYLPMFGAAVVLLEHPATAGWMQSGVLRSACRTWCCATYSACPSLIASCSGGGSTGTSRSRA